MIVVADGGSTKTSWCLLSNGQESYFDTEGYHPFFTDKKFIAASLNNSLPSTVLESAREVNEIFFYSAGGGYSIEADKVLIDGLSEIFEYATIVIETDLLAAARALLQKEAGMAAILGTGSNTCLYDGKKVTSNIESLGFLLGDEGSGAYIGKKLIGDYIRGYMPELLRREFYNSYQLSSEALLNAVYESKTPNSFCGQFTKFVKQHLSEEYCYNLVYQSFDDFFRNIVSHYNGYNRYSFNAVGSVAVHFRDVLNSVVKKYDMALGETLPSSIAGLAMFHSPAQHNLKRH